MLQDISAYVRRRASGRSSPGTPRRPSRAASACSSPGSTIDVLFTPGHSPGHVTYAIAEPSERSCSPATCCSRARSGAPTCPAATTPTLLALDRRAAGRASPTTRAVHPGHMGLTTLGPRAGDEPLPRRARRAVSERLQAPRGTYDVLPEQAAARDARSRPPRDGSSRAAGYRRIETPGLRGTPSCSPAASASRPTSCRRRCTPSRTPAGAR